MFGIKRGFSFSAPLESHTTGGGVVDPAKKSDDTGTAQIIFFNDKKKRSLVPTREELASSSNKESGATWPVIGNPEAEKKIEALRVAHHSDTLLRGADVGEQSIVSAEETLPVAEATVVPPESVSPAVSGDTTKVTVHVEGEAGMAEIQAEVERQFEALEEEIEQEINEIDKMIKSHRKTVQMRAMNGWTHKEEWDKLTAALDHAKADRDVAIDLANEAGHEQEALDQLKKIKESLDTSMLYVTVLPEFDEEPEQPKQPKKKSARKSRRIDVDDAVREEMNMDRGQEKRPADKDDAARAFADNQGGKSVPKERGRKVAVDPVKEGVSEQETVEERTYEKLERAAEDDGAYHTLFGAIAAGLRTMKETVPGIEKRKDELAGRIAEAITLKLEHSLAATGERLGWSTDETNLFAQKIVRKGIEKFLK